MAREGLFVITGGPGAGKTALVEALAARGVRTMPEAGRAIIRQQVAIGGAALPWADREAFAEAMLGWELRSHAEAAAHGGLVLFDRGIPDVAGYRRVAGLPRRPHLDRAMALFRYEPLVFIAPPWREIFHADAERRQDFAEAEATADAMRAVYAEAGYRIEDLRAARSRPAPISCWTASRCPDAIAPCRRPPLV